MVIPKFYVIHLSKQKLCDTFIQTKLYVILISLSIYIYLNSMLSNICMQIRLKKIVSLEYFRYWKQLNIPKVNLFNFLLD